MGRRLIVIRHSRAGNARVDADRSLSPAGRRDARAVGSWLAAARIRPDRIVVSTARRARETWAEAAVALGLEVDPTTDGRIYHNTVGALLDVVHEMPADVQALVLVGHNPSVGDLAASLDDGMGDAEGRHRLGGGYPTSGVAVFELAAPWPELGPGEGRLVAFEAMGG